MSVCESEVSSIVNIKAQGLKTVTIGVLGLQGDFDAHVKTISQIPDAEAVVVKSVSDLEACSGLIIPGGESTTVGKLMERYGLDKAIIHRAAEGMAVFGTCTGMILMAKEIEGSDQQRLALMDMTIRRNAFGRQVDSFEADLHIPELGDQPVGAVFIRAPYVTQVSKNITVLAELDQHRIIFVRQNKMLAAAFHPELTADTRVHRYFVDIARGIV